jgi:hypothetical protein
MSVRIRRLALGARFWGLRQLTIPRLLHSFEALENVINCGTKGRVFQSRCPGLYILYYYRGIPGLPSWALCTSKGPSLKSRAGGDRLQRRLSSDSESETN